MKSNSTRSISNDEKSTAFQPIITMIKNLSEFLIDYLRLAYNEEFLISKLIYVFMLHSTSLAYRDYHLFDSLIAMLK